MKKTIIITILVLLSIGLFAQDQTINGILVMKNNIILQNGELKSTLISEEGKRLYIGLLTEDNSDYIYVIRFNSNTNKSDLRINVGDDDRFLEENITWNSLGVWKAWFVVTNQARVGIGVSYSVSALDINGAVKASKLDLNGTIRSQQVKIEDTNWTDFVFDKDYKLPSLAQVENHFKALQQGNHYLKTPQP